MLCQNVNCTQKISGPLRWLHRLPDVEAFEKFGEKCLLSSRNFFKIWRILFYKIKFWKEFCENIRHGVEKLPKLCLLGETFVYWDIVWSVGLALELIPTQNAMTDLGKKVTHRSGKRHSWTNPLISLLFLYASKSVFEFGPSFGFWLVFIVR